jgi:lipooligosaccharide transport system permease protein
VLAFSVAPPLFLSRPTRLVERNIMVYRRAFLIIFSGFFEPLFYLFSMGFGVGTLIGDVPLGDGRTVPYAVFVAPALLASSAMNGAIYETSFNFYYKLKYAKVYDAIITTPMSLRDVASGEVLWALMRGGMYSIGFLGVVVVLGLVGTGLMSSPVGLLAFPASIVLGYGFAGAGMAVTTFVRQWRDFDLIQLAIMPMFLFSGTFYPIEAYPESLQLIVQCTPLYRGVHMIRAFMTGSLEPIILLDVTYLLIMGTIGLAITSRRLGKLLQA